MSTKLVSVFECCRFG